ncbi:uncharacterized protein [Rutidosis leptorrhynchoides]|uniref:uncharacterized protein n=1 Tax=Rutidosis leptorrhynchoides TaxID=125765 RepID=UPI003A99AE6C
MCDFNRNKDVQNERVRIRIGDQILHPQNSFTYLGSVLYKSGKIDENVTHCVKTCWLKWRAATWVLCEKKIPLKLKEKFIKMANRLAMLYGSKCLPMTKTQSEGWLWQKMRMLRWICGKTMLDKT